MSVPPSHNSGNVGGTPPGGRGSQGPRGPSGDGRKDFKLPDRKSGKDQKGKDKKKEKKEAGPGEVPELKQTGIREKELKTSELEGTQAKESLAKAKVEQVTKLISAMVDNMQVGQIGGKEYATMQLSQEVPTAFAGSQLTTIIGAEGLEISFSNFATAGHEADALNLINAHKEELQNLVQRLEAKNINISQLNIGNNSVTLPQAQSLPPPFQATAAAQAERGEREGGEGEEQQQDQEEPEQ